MRTKSLRYSGFVTTSFDADKFAITFAPADAWNELGGILTHRSSHISHARRIPFRPSIIRFGVNGNVRSQFSEALSS